MWTFMRKPRAQARVACASTSDWQNFTPARLEASVESSVAGAKFGLRLACAGKGLPGTTSAQAHFLLDEATGSGFSGQVSGIQAARFGCMVASRRTVWSNS